MCSSHIRYGLLYWDKENKTRLNKVNVLVSRALRWVCYSSYDKSGKNLTITKKN